MAEKRPITKPRFIRDEATAAAERSLRVAHDTRTINGDNETTMRQQHGSHPGYTRC